LERLINDGRIQPERIEEIVKKTKEEIDKVIFRAGEELAHKVGIYNLPTEMIKLLGKFKYRYSYGQNMILHTLEETRIGVALAHELKADVNMVKLGCLFHDIGKVISDKEGSHIELGVDLLKKYRFPQKVVDCVAAHHEDVPFPSVEAIIVYIADAVSGGRPGARHEDFEEYLKRIKTIEEAAKTRKGVKEAFALQAGRELRVIVKTERLPMMKL
jgi:ribonuclease Y